MIVNDHPIMRDGLRLAVENEPDMRVVCQAATQTEAIHGFEASKPNVVLIDLQGFDSPGFLAMHALRRVAPLVPIVVLSTFSDEASWLPTPWPEHTVCLPKTATPGEVLRALRQSVTGTCLRDQSES
jgi:DNA-binding NarL/FixJ family response regulator